MGKPKSPAPPDPYRVAGADYAFNNPSQVTPHGSLTNTPPSFGPNNTVTGMGTSTLTLSPELQGLFDQQLGVSGNSLGEALRRQQQLYGGGAVGSADPKTGPRGGDFRPDLSMQPGGQAGGMQGGQGGFPQVPQGLDFSRVRGLPTDFSADRQAVTDATFGQMRGLLDPVFAEQERGLRSTLSDQGLPAGSEARGYDLGQFNDSRNRAYQDAALQSVLAGGGEQSRMFGLQQQGRQSDISDQLQQINALQNWRGMQFNELQALLGQQQVQQPGLQNFFQPRGADFTGAQAISSNAANQNYAARAGMFGDLMDGLFGLGSAAIGRPR